MSELFVLKRSFLFMSSDSMDANAAGCSPEIISNEVDGQYADASVPVFVATAESDA